MRQPLPRLVHCAAVLFAIVPLQIVANAQQGAVTFKNFHHYPNGQWQQQGQAYRNGQPMGPAISNTTCSSPLSPAQVAAVKSFGNAAAPQCTIHVLTDTESTADYEQVCDMGGATQVNHMTMHAVDDKTVRTEIRMSMNGQMISETRMTNHYQGTCTPTAATPAMPILPQMPKPSAEDCKQIVEMKQQAAEGAKSCAAASPAERAGCEALMQHLTRQVEMLSASCR